MTTCRSSSLEVRSWRTTCRRVTPPAAEKLRPARPSTFRAGALVRGSACWVHAMVRGRCLSRGPSDAHLASGGSPPVRRPQVRASVVRDWPQDADHGSQSATALWLVSEQASEDVLAAAAFVVGKASGDSTERVGPYGERRAPCPGHRVAGVAAAPPPGLQLVDRAEPMPGRAEGLRS